VIFRAHHEYSLPALLVGCHPVAEVSLAIRQVEVEPLGIDPCASPLLESRADYTYTDEGNLSTVALNDAILATCSNYTASGRPQNVRYGNGVATTYGYDTVNHLTSLATARGDTILQNLGYDWYSRANTAGLNLGSITDNRPSKVAADGSITDETQTYTHDPLYRLTEATGAWGATTPNTYVQKRYEYDSIGNPTTFGGVTDRTLTVRHPARTRSPRRSSGTAAGSTRAGRPRHSPGTPCPANEALSRTRPR